MKYILKIIPLFFFHLLSEFVVNGNDFITLKEIDGRSWLVRPNGQPFFAHGITHVSNKDAKLNYQKLSKARKSLGFNSYG